MAQAYEDINCAKEVFTSLINLNKLFELQLQLENNRHMLIKANELNDMKAYAALEKNRVLLIKQIPIEDSCPGEMFEGHTYELTFDPSLLGGPKIGKKEMIELLKMINEKRNKKINIDMFEELYFDEK